LDVLGIPFKLKAQKLVPGRAFRFRATPKTSSIIFGTLTMSVINYRTNALAIPVQRTMVEFFPNADGEAWRIFTLPQVNINDVVCNGKVILEILFEPKQKSSSSIISPDWKTSPSQTVARPFISHADPRKEHGIVGLKNNATQCYLNSVLQLLFHIPAVRRLIYSIDPRNPQIAIKNNILLNLQMLFYQLQKSPTGPSATSLMISFGWSAIELRTQHDAAEMWLALINRLFDLLPTDASGRLRQLFEFQLKNTIKNDEFGYRSEIIHESNHLTVTIVSEGSPAPRTLQEALDNLFNPSSASDYPIEGHGRQDVILQNELGTLPEILAIHISRFAFDPRTLQGYKISQSLEFSEILTVRLHNNLTNYHLRSVFIHYGTSLGSGHYGVAVRPGLDDHWFLISDLRVTAFSFSNLQKQAAVDGAFFVFARTDTEELNFKPLDDIEIPPLVEELAKTTEVETSGVTVISDICFVQNANTKTYGYRCVEYEQIIDVSKNDTLVDVYQKVVEAMNPTPDFRLWLCDMIGRPSSILLKNKTRAGSLLGNQGIVFVERCDKYREINDCILVFLQLFVGHSQELTFLGSQMMIETESIENQLSQIRTVCKHSADTQYNVFLHTDGRSVKLIDQKVKIKDLEIQNGSFIVFQMVGDVFVKEPESGVISYFVKYPQEFDGLYPTFLREIQYPTTMN
jgi:hypothetical protein